MPAPGILIFGLNPKEPAEVDSISGVTKKEEGVVIVVAPREALNPDVIAAPARYTRAYRQPAAGTRLSKKSVGPVTVVPFTEPIPTLEDSTNFPSGSISLF